MSALVFTEQLAAPPTDERSRPDASPAEGHAASLLALHAWFHDWSTTARVFVKRKDWLWKMGLVRKRWTKTVHPTK